jgi:formate hydrogenlyase subunit 3/multisubunit Na+/H+ antiporter MnhD subunit
MVGAPSPLTSSSGLGGFLIPLLNRLGKTWVVAGFIAALAAMTLISAFCAVRLFYGAEPIEILTGGSTPPYSINLRMGLAEAFAATSVNLIGLLGAFYFVREKYAVMLLYLVIVMGIQGMVMTRDMFNLFVFLEIVSIATYGLLSLGSTTAALSASFKFLMATIVASTLFLLGTMLLYAVTGMLNIDDLIANRATVEGPVGFAALMLLLACLLLELKPFPANGWGLDVYETAPSSVASLIATGVSAGVLFALYNLFPLVEKHAEVIAILGGATFVVSNLIGLAQIKAQRLLGYSSVGQMGLVSMALALLHLFDAEAATPLVVGGLFVNHLLAKAGLFWLAGYVGKENIEDWSVLTDRPVIFVFALLLCAIAGLPPFPAFWAKWQLIFALASGEGYVWIALVLLGSLLEAAYLFRWFGQSLHRPTDSSVTRRDPLSLLPVVGAALLLFVCGYGAARLAGLNSLWVAVPLAVGAAIYLLDGLTGRAKAVLVFVLLALDGYWIIRGMSGINFLFAMLLFGGSLTLTIACLYRGDERPGFYPLLAVLLLSLSGLPHASTSLEFFFLFELVTLSSYFLIARRRQAVADAFSYLIFSLAAGYFLLAGFAIAHAVTGSWALAALLTSGKGTGVVFALLAIGFLIKAGTIGVHVWLPGAYAEAEDDVSAMLSAVVSKVPIFGLMVGTYASILSEADLSLAHALGWIGMLTALAGAMLAVQQDDVKRTLAYSSMSQPGYIVTAIALMSHLGWVTALYLTANHPMTKGSCLSSPLRSFCGQARGFPISAVPRVPCPLPLQPRRSLSWPCPTARSPGSAANGCCWAMMEKGWYGPTAMAARDIRRFSLHDPLHSVIFLDPPESARGKIAEAPAASFAISLDPGDCRDVVLPQTPDRADPEAIDPYFASTLVWDGMSLNTLGIGTRCQQCPPPSLCPPRCSPCCGCSDGRAVKWRTVKGAS